jgi:hypothetical protein
MKKIILLTLMALYMSNVKSQDTIVPNRDGVTITIPHPLDFALKTRFGFDYRTQKKSYGITFTSYNVYEGYQIYGNMRLYNKSKLYLPTKGEAFTQYKAGFGGNKGYIYNFIGIGRGTRFYIDKENHFIFETLWGIKIPLTANLDYFERQGLAGTFLIIGPGSIIDLNFNLGYRF